MAFLNLIWLILPAAVANLVPPFAAIIIPKYNHPIDFGQTLRGRRILGDHKTIRGLVVGTAAGFLVFVLQKSISPIAYQPLSYIFGFLLAFTALFGDMIKSFIKRQLNIISGTSWFPWDQIDWLIGPIVLLHLTISLTIFDVILILTIGLISHLLTKYVGFLLRVNTTKI